MGSRNELASPLIRSDLTQCECLVYVYLAVCRWKIQKMSLQEGTRRRPQNLSKLRNINNHQDEAKSRVLQTRLSWEIMGPAGQPYEEYVLINTMPLLNSLRMFWVPPSQVMVGQSGRYPIFMLLFSHARLLAFACSSTKCTMGEGLAKESSLGRSISNLKSCPAEKLNSRFDSLPDIIRKRLVLNLLQISYSHSLSTMQSSAPTTHNDWH